jgi:hypothetical protein
LSNRGVIVFSKSNEIGPKLVSMPYWIKLERYIILKLLQYKMLGKSHE